MGLWAELWVGQWAGLWVGLWAAALWWAGQLMEDWVNSRWQCQNIHRTLLELCRSCYLFMLRGKKKKNSMKEP